MEREPERLAASVGERVVSIAVDTEIDRLLSRFSDDCLDRLDRG